MLSTDEKYMKEAIRQAKKAYAIGEVPIGCVIVYQDKIIGRGYNRRTVDKKGKQKDTGLEAGRVYNVCDAGTMSDVFRSHCPVTDDTGRCWMYESKSGVCRFYPEPSSDAGV